MSPPSVTAPPVPQTRAPWRPSSLCWRHVTTHTHTRQVPGGTQCRAHAVARGASHLSPAGLSPYESAALHLHALPSQHTKGLPRRSSAAEPFQREGYTNTASLSSWLPRFKITHRGRTRSSRPPARTVPEHPPVLPPCCIGQGTASLVAVSVSPSSRMATLCRRVCRLAADTQASVAAAAAMRMASAGGAVSRVVRSKVRRTQCQCTCPAQKLPRPTRTFNKPTLQASTHPGRHPYIIAPTPASARHTGTRRTVHSWLHTILQAHSPI